MSRDRKPSEVEVTRVDLRDCEAEALKYLRAHAETDRNLGSKTVKMPETVGISMKYGIVEVGGEVYALCEEGVGPDYPITAEKPLAVDVYITRHEGDGDKAFIPMFPACSLKLTGEMLRERAIGESVPLHEFVRSFGARLEGNYESWRRLLEGKVSAAA